MNSFLHFKKLLIIPLLLMMGNVCLGQVQTDVPSSGILSPVIGQFQHQNFGSTCGGISTTIWGFCQSSHHTTGVGGAFDYNAYDCNLSSNQDAGKNVYPVADGWISHLPNWSGNSEGQLLIRHVTNGKTWYSGYLHMNLITDKKATNGAFVSANEVIGIVDDISAFNPPAMTEHLHFAIYYRSSTNVLTSVTRQFVERTNCPSIPITITPSNASTNIGIPVFFNWEDVSGSNPEYRIHVSTSNSGWTASNGFTTAQSPSGSVKVNTNLKSVSSYTWSQYQSTDNPFTPQPFTTYYYTVKSFVCGQSSNYSTVKSFTTGCLGTTAVMSTPTNQQTNVTVPVNFDWQSSTGTDPLYRIQVSTNPNLWTKIDGFTTATTPNPTIRVNESTQNISSFTWSNSAQYPPQSGVTYYYSVKTFACNHNTEWSPVRSFTIGNTSTCAVSINPNPLVGGTVSGSGTFTCGTSRTVIATANSGYTFSNWTENGNVVSTSASYPFTLSANRTLVANFNQTVSNCTLTLNRNPTAGGTVTGSGTFTCGTSRTVLASANSGYTFSNWTENGNIVSTNASYPFTLSANRTLTSNFTPSTTGTTINIIGSIGAVTFPNSIGNNKLSCKTEKNISFSIKNISSLAVVRSFKLYIVDMNNNFVGELWNANNLSLQPNETKTYNRTTNSELGSAVVSGAGFYKLVLKGDTGTVGKITLDSPTVVCQNGSCNPQNIEIVCPCTLNINANPTVGGTVTGSGTFTCGTSRTVIATANSGYTFSNWTENGNVISTNASYPFTLSANRTLTANFSQNQTATCVSCPSYDYELPINSDWGNDSQSISENSCKTYRFLATPGNNYTFKTGCEDGATASFDSDLELYDTNCKLMTSSNDFCNTASKIEWICDYTASNWIYLKVKANQNSFGNYTLAYNELPSLSTKNHDNLIDGLKVYPNPTKGVLNIETNQININKISIIDNLGAVIKNIKVDSSKYKLNINNLPTAIYFLKIETEQGKQTVKIIKE